MLKYRREIDGLRTLAVLPIILFHAGFHWFSGGYVGVDIFFVISGYLITSILWEEKKSGGVSLGRFYERRARRILPALFLVIICCLPFAWAWMIPDQLDDFLRSVIGVSLFSSNILFWKQSGYFAAAAELKPLLHTWSLGVEEQFYLFFPLLFVALSRLGKRWVITGTAVLAIASFNYSQWACHHAPSANFYLIFSRAWELLTGALVAFYLENAHQHHPRPWHGWASAAGFSAILFSIFCYTASTPIPSVYALAPVLGTALIILYAGPGNWVGRFLSLKPMVGIGLISYSAYLWHQPLFAFAHIHNVAPDRLDIFAGLALVSLVLAYLSWRFVETPFRKSRTWQRRRVFKTAAALCLLLASWSWFGLQFQGFPDRFDDYQKKVLEAAKYENARLYRISKCELDLSQDYSNYQPECFADPGSPKAKTVLWGDSIVAGMWAGLKKAYPDYSIEQLTYSGCPPLIDYTSSDRPLCAETFAHVIDHITTDKKVTRVFMLSDWQTYIIGHPGLPQILAKTVRMLQDKRPDLDIVVIGPLPKWRENVPHNLAFEWVSFTGDLHEPIPDYVTFKREENDLRAALTPTHVTFISALDIACPDNKCLVANFDNGALNFWTFDTIHPTEWSSDFMAREVKARLGNR